MVNVVESELMPHVYDYEVILVGMGINNSFSTGFANDVAINFPEVRESEINGSPYGDRRKFGNIFSTKCDGIEFCMCYMHNGGYRKKNNEYVSYDDLKSCLNAVVRKFKGKRIASPLLGFSKYDGNGDKGKLLQIFESVFAEQDIDVYLYEHINYNDVTYKELLTIGNLFKNGNISREEYSRRRNEIYWRRKNGIFKPMPEDYQHKSGEFSWEDVITVKKKDLED